jgi:hypothetical protein
MGPWPEHLFKDAEFLSLVSVLQRQQWFKRSVLSIGKRVREAISLH